MSLPPSSRLGPYEVTAKLGEGGMGEVYRATDSHLKRSVAIKVLPAAVAANPDRLARFQREAEVLAALNHPNIAAIYGIVDLPPEGGSHASALVMELVEGDDLSQRIARGALPIDEALPIARQIADALEAAHEQGIVHRDLKPGNVKVKADGTVKVLDFGLAKAVDPASPSSADAMKSPTFTAHATQMGVILGTAAYMAPEQARGKVVDKRADVWAFGAVFYEMLTGARAFPGDDITDTLAAVVRGEPDWTRVPKDLSPTLLVFLRRCLEKDPRQRVGDIHDVRLALDGAFEIAAPQASAGSTPASRHRLSPWVAGAALIVAAALAVPAVRHLGEAPPQPPPEIRSEIVTPGAGAFALSPDGRHLVFEATSDGVSRLWLRPLFETTAQPLGGTEGGFNPFWSPDSRSIAFAAGGLKRLDLGGGPPRVILADFTRGTGTWGADDVILVADVRARGEGNLRRASASGGSAPGFAPLGNKVNYFRPSFLPDGRRFLFTAVGAPEVAGIYLGTLDGAAPTRLTPDVSAAELYVPAGDGRPVALPGAAWLLWGRAGTTVGQRLDTATRTLTGEPTTLAPDLGSISAVKGLLAYRSGGPLTVRQFTWFDARGTQLETLGEPGDLRALSLSPDGKSVAMTVSSDASQGADIWILEVRRGLRTRFTFAQREARPVWSADGRAVAFSSSRRGHADLYRKSVDGAVGSEELLYADDRDKEPSSYSPDGRYLLYSSRDPKTKSDVWVLPLIGDRKPFAFAQTEFVESQGEFSPDGRWIAYVSDESGTAEVYAAPFPGPGGKRLISTKQAGAGQGGVPVWRPDGKEIFYIAPDRTLMAVAVTSTGPTLEAGLARKLFGPIPAVGGRNYALSSDGKRFLTYTVPGERSNAPITLIQNWNPERKK